ncbi:hypothetical protein Bbelb_090250 [Branchiostoma belcheri]|nr:hypothetical protein Bbelb_090250 [Branchiostoma belcheri]
MDLSPAVSLYPLTSCITLGLLFPPTRCERSVKPKPPRSAVIEAWLAGPDALCAEGIALSSRRSGYQDYNNKLDPFRTIPHSDPGQMTGGCLAQVVVTHYARKKKPTSIGGMTSRPGRGTWSAGSPANLEQRTGVECRQPRPTARGRGKRVSRGPVNPRRSSTHTWKAPGF